MKIFLRRVCRLPVVLFLVLYHFLLMFYMEVLKFLRKPAIFPGG